jgi:hypothetical protein
MEQTDVTPLPVEEQISNELIKNNVTESKIAELREKYLPLKINGIEDKEGYLVVKDARKDTKGWRVLAEKLCKAGREDAVAIQKAWIAKEKDITKRIGEVENYLEKQEKDYEAAVAKDKEEKKRKQEEQLILRQQMLSSMNVLYADGNYTLGEVSFELSVVKECDQDIWEESILPKFKAEYEKVEAERIEQDRIKQEREAEMKRQQDEMERREKELADREAALKKAEEERLKKEKEEQLQKEFEERQRIEKLWRNRLDQLNPIGWNGQQAFAKYDESVIVATFQQLVNWNEDEFVDAMSKHQRAHSEYVLEQEHKRLAEIEVQKETERIKTLGKSRIQILNQYNAETQYTVDSLGKLPDVDWQIILTGWQDAYEADQKKKWEAEQEEKRKQEELKKQQEMEKAGDKVKWEEIMNKVNDIEVYEMKSSQYRHKARILREKLEEIKAL